MLTTLWILLAVSAAWAILMIFLVRVIKKNLRYLECPPPNHSNKCKSGARTDLVNLDSWHMYLTAVFIFPIRLTGILTTIIIMTSFVLLIKLLFCGIFC